AITPWLSIKQELGFSIDEAKLGRLKLLAGTIEKKIAETGMVTLNSDFQAMIKTQQNYLLQPTAENLKKFNRAMASFENMSNVYAMLDLYEKEIGEFKKTFVRVSELSQQLNDAEYKLLNTEEAMKSLISD
ncbi:methyl-accepting chemotaxis protein, partial [Vibrio paracholerae]|nr:methyl-accepting chemotaxis protein [Vibrio paracholerae]